jgi:hypothetical protein
MTADLSPAIWRKSSYSNGAGGDCVEVATNLPGLVAVRDSKDPEGPALLLTRGQWRALLADTR